MEEDKQNEVDKFTVAGATVSKCVGHLFFQSSSIKEEEIREITSC